ncbi:MAG: hypothetical protein ABSF09_09805 [Candidatus Bathyarchaeia archaeon]
MSRDQAAALIRGLRFRYLVPREFAIQNLVKFQLDAYTRLLKEHCPQMLKMKDERRYLYG